MVKALTISLAVGLFSGFASAAYPATFPFENESTEIVGPLAATPSDSYDEDDSGGYIYTYFYALTEVSTTDCFVNNGANRYRFKVQWGIPPIMPTSQFNCTAKGPIFDEDTFDSDEFAGQKMCDDGPKSCCPQFRGEKKYRANTDAHMENDILMLEGFQETGLCTETFHVGSFCSLFNDNAIFWCNEQILGDLERTIENTVCFDSWTHWLLDNCPVFSAAFPVLEGLEPDHYMQSMSNAENIGWLGIHWLSDKVCLPYSYFFPETAKATEDTADDDDETEKSADATESDSAGFVVVTSFVGLAMLF